MGGLPIEDTSSIDTSHRSKRCSIVILFFLENEKRGARQAVTIEISVQKCDFQKSRIEKR
jgi:hypothetical protein